MEYRNLGRSSLKVSAVSLGAWLTFGGTEDIEITQACIKTALEQGINFFDLADVYAGGEAESVVGRAIRDLGVSRHHLVLSSKAFWPMSGDVNDRGLSRKHLMESVEGSLRRLGVDYLDLYFCHRFDPETPLDEVVRAMDDLVHQGKILYWGTSVWTAAQIEAAVGTAMRFNAYLPQVEQPRYNMLDRHIEPEILPTAVKNGMGVVVFSPLAQGLLTGKYNAGVPEGTRAANSRWLERDMTDLNLERVRRLSVLAEEMGITVAQLALAWVLRWPAISSAITGATKPQHVQTNVAAAGVRLSDDVLAEIEQILENAPKSS